MSNRSFLRRGGEGADAPTPRQSDQTGNAACRGSSGVGSRSSTSRASLRDEIGRLKGGPGRPDIKPDTKPSSMEKASEAPQPVAEVPLPPPKASTPSS